MNGDPFSTSLMKHFMGDNKSITGVLTNYEGDDGVLRELILRCPCGEISGHLLSALIGRGGTGGERPGIVLEFYCEGRGHDWWIEIHNHKGDLVATWGIGKHGDQLFSENGDRPAPEGLRIDWGERRPRS